MTNNRIQGGADICAGTLPRLLQVDEVAELLQETKSHLCGQIQHGNIPCVRFRHAVRVKYGALLRYIEANEGSGMNPVYGGAK